MGVAGYSEIARILGLNSAAERYADMARRMAVKWEEVANEGDRYHFAFNRNNTWSQKYNIIWDRMWNLNIFLNNVVNKEIDYYLTEQNLYGLPLDSRRGYIKSDWIMWTAAMSLNREIFEKFVDPLYKYINRTASCVPISDWHDTKTGRMTGFKACSVVGGYWIRVLMDKMNHRRYGQ